VRLPEVADLPPRRAADFKLRYIHSHCILRPCRSGRYPAHIWDGPFHRLIDNRASPRILEAYEKIKRRSAHVSNYCRWAFLRSCVVEDHPIHSAAKAQHTSAIFKGEDFRDMYSFGNKLGEGRFGITFECVRSTRDGKVIQAVKLAEHKDNWWGQLSMAQNLKWKLLSRELEALRKLDNQHILKIGGVFIDDNFTYMVMDKCDCNLSTAANANVRFGKCVLPQYVVGELGVQILRSLAFLHGQRIVHCNVKAENYMLDGTKLRRQFRLQLADIGAARYLQRVFS